MGIIQELVKDIPLPRMIKVRQTFPSHEVTDLVRAIKAQFENPASEKKVKPGMKVAVAVGSRGVARIADVAEAVVAELKRLGACPFVVPCMGSHGGATAEGQKMILSNLGVTEEKVGCSIVSSMEVVQIGQLENGLPVYIDKHAYEADGIVVINRVKPHTAFRGNNESGLVKMITIGLGKQKGADSCHAYSFKYMAENIINMARISLSKANILFGVAVVENAYDRIAKLVVVPSEKLIETDRQLLIEAKQNMAHIKFSEFDVLIVDRIGKEISGDGMDPNITGRYPTPYASGGPVINKVVILDLTDKTHGNANGMGMADFTTKTLFEKMDRQATYANCLTSTVTNSVRLPVILDNDKEAVAAAIKTCNARDISAARVIRIQDTLHLGEIWISESLLEAAKGLEGIKIIGTPEELKFDAGGKLL